MWLYRSHVQHMHRDNSHILTLTKQAHPHIPTLSFMQVHIMLQTIYTYMKKYLLQPFIYNFSLCVTGLHYLVLSL